MNAGIVILQDGTPCLVYDEALEGPVRHIEFCRENFLVTIVHEKAARQSPVLQLSKIAGSPCGTITLDYPLDHRFVELLEERKTIAVGAVIKGQVENVKIVPVVFTNT